MKVFEDNNVMEVITENLDLNYDCVKRDNKIKRIKDDDFDSLYEDENVEVRIYPCIVVFFEVQDNGHCQSSHEIEDKSLQMVNVESRSYIQNNGTDFINCLNDNVVHVNNTNNVHRRVRNHEMNVVKDCVMNHLHVNTTNHVSISRQKSTNRWRQWVSHYNVNGVKVNHNHSRSVSKDFRNRKRDSNSFYINVFWHNDIINSIVNKI